MLFILSLTNLVWFVFASISWLRYAFLGLSFTSLFVARFFAAWLAGKLNLAKLLNQLRRKQPIARQDAWRWAKAGWLVVLVLVPFVQTTHDIVSSPFDAPAAMAQYLNAHVPKSAVIETWEPEMGFLTDHNYHFPPASLLPKAVAYIWLHAPPPAQYYNVLQAEAPKYVLVGQFGRWVQLYAPEILQTQYRLETRIGVYELYRRIDAPDQNSIGAKNAGGG